MRYGCGNVNCEKKPEPENNLNPETGLYDFVLIVGKFWGKRCQGKSSITGKQCQKPAIKTSRTQKCVNHGGNSGHKKNPKFAEHLTKTGEFTREKIAKKIQNRLDIRLMGEVLAVLEGHTVEKKQSGRRVKNYKPITNMEEVEAFLKDKAKRDR